VLNFLKQLLWYSSHPAGQAAKTRRQEIKLAWIHMYKKVGMYIGWIHSIFIDALMQGQTRTLAGGCIFILFVFLSVEFGRTRILIAFFLPQLTFCCLLGPAVQRKVNANPGLKFNPLFQSVSLFTAVGNSRENCCYWFWQYFEIVPCKGNCL
jgi:hypothetical protein